MRFVLPRPPTTMRGSVRRYSIACNLVFLLCGGCRATTHTTSTESLLPRAVGGYVCDVQVMTRLAPHTLFARAQSVGPSFGLRAAAFDSVENRISLDDDDGPLLPDWPGHLGVRYRLRIGFVAADSGLSGSRILVSPGVNTWPANTSDAERLTIAAMAGAFVTRLLRAVDPDAPSQRLCNDAEKKYLSASDAARIGRPTRDLSADALK